MHIHRLHINGVLDSLAHLFRPQKFTPLRHVQIQMDSAMTSQMIQQLVFLITKVTLEHTVYAMGAQMQR